MVRVPNAAPDQELCDLARWYLRVCYLQQKTTDAYRTRRLAIEHHVQALWEELERTMRQFKEMSKDKARRRIYEQLQTIVEDEVGAGRKRRGEDKKKKKKKKKKSRESNETLTDDSSLSRGLDGDRSRLRSLLFSGRRIS